MGAATVQPVQLDEDSLIREKIAELTLPAGVKFKRIEQFYDWTGDPAVRIYFSVSRKARVVPKFIKELSALTVQLQDNILGLGLGKFPFVKFDDAR